MQNRLSSPNPYLKKKKQNLLREICAKYELLKTIFPAIDELACSRYMGEKTDHAGADKKKVER
jgi:hypothetical protein